MHELRKSDLWLWMFGLGFLTCMLSWTWLSHQFIYGEGHASRPILVFLLSYGLAWTFFLGAVYTVWRAPRAVSILPILTVALLARVILLPSQLIQENDVYRYVLDGQVLAQGGNPYEFSPRELSDEGPAEIRSSLGSDAAQLVLGRIGYPQIPTVYPPLAQAVFAAGVFIGGWHWEGQRLILLLVDLMTVLGLIALVDLLAIGRGWIVLYAWNPLALKETVNSVHLDVLVAFCLVCLILTLVAFQRTRTWGWLILSSLTLSGAILSKLYPVLLLPIIATFVWRQSRRWWHLVFLAGACTTLVLLAFLPFVNIGLERLFRGLIVYANDWQMNEGFFSILSHLSSHPRVWALGICVAVALLLPIFRPPQHACDLAEQFQWVILTWFLVMPSPFPWYSIPLLALLVISESLPIRIGTLTLSGVAVLYYLRFQIEYHEIDNLWWAVTRYVEHSLIWLSIGLGWVLRRRLAQQEELFQSASLTVQN